MVRPRYWEAFYVQKVLMILTGIWPNKDYGLWYAVHGFLTSFVLQALFITSSLAKVFSKSAEIFDVIFVLCINFSVVAYFIKVIIMHGKKDSFYKILSDLEQSLFVEHETHLDTYLEAAIWNSNTTRRVFHYCVFISVIFLGAFPVFDNSGSKRPLALDLPIPIEEVPFSLYVVVYVLVTTAIAVCACNSANIDSLACSFMALGAAQLQILGDNLRTSASRYKSLDQNAEPYKIYDEEVAGKLKKCVKHHNAIAEYVNKLEETFTYIFLAQFLISAIAICFTGFGFVMIPGTNMMSAALLAYFTTLIGEISIYCLFGDELVVESLKINDACYMSEWNNCGPEIGKLLIIIMERSRRPLMLTAGKFTVLSRGSLFTILKSSISYFAVLRKLYGTDE